MLLDAPMPNHRLGLLTWIVFAAPTLALAQDAVPTAAANDFASLQKRVAHIHAQRCCDLYRDCLAKAKALQTSIDRMLASPSAVTLGDARTAWLQARVAYCMTEALRFHDGPIEPIEPLLNAWPVDESYIDYVQGDPDAGIVHDRQHFPHLSQAVLTLANERGGEANISVGWHAIEFLLWGQDLRTDGAGDRPFTDYVPGKGIDADRRREYLTCITELLVQQLSTLVEQWTPDAPNYRRRFEADPAGAVRRMLTGATVLTAFELGGERMAVAYETRDQEQEHDCFSDATCQDLVADQRGIMHIFEAGPDAAQQPGLLALIEQRNPKLARSLATQLDACLAKLQAIPQPFDNAMRGADDSPGRLAIRAALDALDAQAELLSIAGQTFGYELPVRPGGR